MSIAPESPRALLKDLDAKIADANRRVRVLRRTRLLVKAYFDTGSMSVILDNGTRWDERHGSASLPPVEAGYYLMNVRALATRMAEASL
jgi:hypothetical protein